MEKGTWKRWAMCFVLLTLQQVSKAAELPLLMPHVRPQENDLYLCIDKKIDDDYLYITGFQPKASMSVAHHILIYGCSEPGMVGGKPWNCGEMHSGGRSQYVAGPVCKDSGRIIYAWAMDAPDLKLPNDVAFKIGAATAMKYLVIQVHYKDASSFLPPSISTDNSGVILQTTTKARDKTAGVYLIAANGRISPRSITYMEAACAFPESLTIVPFAYRVHTHKLGKVVSGYRLRNGVWTEIGRRNPQLPQMFYPVNDTKSLDITKGDILAARCTMENLGYETVEVGPTSDDEMCNFYIMYYTSGNQDLEQPVCTSPGPPSWRWSDFLRPESIPLQASVDPITNNWFEEYQQKINDWSNNLLKSQQRFVDDVNNYFNRKTNFDFDYPNINIPPMNVYESEPQPSYYNPPERSAYDYRDLEASRPNPSNFRVASSRSKSSVVSSSSAQKQASYKMINGKWVKVSEETVTQPPTVNAGSSNFNFGSAFNNINMPKLSLEDFPSIKVPVMNIPPMNPPAGANPNNWESFQTFDDKNGGKGSQYQKSQNNFQELKIPGGKGFVKSSSSSSRTSYSISKSSSSP